MCVVEKVEVEENEDMVVDAVAHLVEVNAEGFEEVEVVEALGVEE